MMASEFSTDFLNVDPSSMERYRLDMTLENFYEKVQSWRKGDVSGEDLLAISEKAISLERIRDGRPDPIEGGFRRMPIQVTLFANQCVGMLEQDGDLSMGNDMKDMWREYFLERLGRDEIGLLRTITDYGLRKTGESGDTKPNYLIERGDMSVLLGEIRKTTTAGDLDYAAFGLQLGTFQSLMFALTDNFGLGRDQLDFDALAQVVETVMSVNLPGNTREVRLMNGTRSAFVKTPLYLLVEKCREKSVHMDEIARLEELI